MSWNSWGFILASAVRGVLCAIGGDLLLEAITDREQLRLVHDIFAAMLEVVFVDAGLDDRIDRAALSAEAAEDALEQIDVVARGTALTVAFARSRINRDRQCRAHRLAQLAGDATLFAVRIAAQRVQTAETVRLGDVLHRVAHGVLRLEHVAHRQSHALEQLDQQQTLEISGYAIHWILYAPMPTPTQP